MTSINQTPQGPIALCEPPEILNRLTQLEASIQTLGEAVDTLVVHCAPICRITPLKDNSATPRPPSACELGDRLQLSLDNLYNIRCTAEDLNTRLCI